MKWLLSNPMACFDTETTGVNVEEDRIVTACVGTLQPAGPGQCGRGHPFSADNTYIRPDGQRQCRTCNRIRRARSATT